jgi:hypothetical protein
VSPDWFLIFIVGKLLNRQTRKLKCQFFCA